VWRRERDPLSRELDDIREYVRGIARLVMSIDARLDEVVELLRDEGESDGEE